MAKIVSTRYRGFRIIIRYVTEKSCYVTVTKTEGQVYFFEDYWPVVLLDTIVHRINNYIEDQEFAS